MPTEKTDPTEDLSLNHNYDTHTTTQVEQGMLLKISSSCSDPLSTQKSMPEPFQPHSPDLLSPPTARAAVHVLSWRHTNSTAPIFAQHRCFCEQRRKGATRRKKKTEEEKLAHSSEVMRKWDSRFSKFFSFNYFWKTQLNHYKTVMQTLKNVFDYLNPMKC